MKKTSSVLLCLAVLLSACVAPQEANQGPEPIQGQEPSQPIKIKTLDPEGGQEHGTNNQSDHCQAQKWAAYRGQSYEAVKSQLPKHRWKRFGYKYTEEYFQTRLNIQTDADHLITNIYCG